MSSFTSEPYFEKLPGKLIKVRRRFSYHVGSKYSNFIIKIPYGFVSDGASIPRILWSILPPYAFGYLKPAIIHDYLYQSKLVNRELADDIFLEAMGVCGTNVFVRYLMHYAVRFFGWLGYDKNNLPE